MSQRAHPYRHTIAVRWGEVDQQGVVFNAHYLAYMDDAMETWLRPIRALGDELGWDMMLRRCHIEWHGPLGARDLLDLEVAVSRFGRTSWDLDYRGTCAGRLVFTARVVYVSVAAGTSTPVETPRQIREFMGEPIDLLAAATGQPASPR
jgi:acyl-CoA thioester hydrolase